MTLRLRRAAAVFAAAVLCSVPAAALDPERDIHQYSHRVWNTENGLPQDSIGDLLQTRDGYVWIATQEGLARFDGVRFVVFDSSNTPAMASNHVASLLQARDGALWIGVYGGGVVRLADGVFRAFRAKEGLTDETVTSLAEDSRGVLWVSTDNGLYRFDGGRFTWDAATKNIPGSVTCLKADPSGGLWIGTTAGLARLEGGTVKTIRTSNGLSDDFVTALSADPGGGLWIGTKHGLTFHTGGRFETFSRRDGLDNDWVRSLTVDRDSNLWVGTSGGLFRRAGGRFSSYTARSGLTSDFVTALHEGRDGELWIGTGGGGINLLRDGSFVGYGADDGIGSDGLYCVTGDRAGGVWAGDYTGEVFHLVGGAATRLGIRQHLQGKQVRALLQDSRGVLWIGSDFGLTRYEAGKASDMTIRDGLPSNVVRTMVEDRDGDMWIGTDGGGVSRLKAGVFTSFSTRDGLAGNQVRTILVDRDGSLWIGTYGGLSHLVAGRFTNYSTANGLSSELIRCLHQDADGTLWIGTYGGGLNSFKDGRFVSYTSRQGLFRDVIYQILEDRRGNLWMSCNKGVFRVDKRDLESYRAGRLKTFRSVAYGRSDGMPTDECNGGSPAGWSMANGTLWFPTMRGLAMTDPSILKIDRSAPNLLFEEGLADGQRFDLRRPAHLPAGTKRVEFHYTALDFSAPNKIEFSHRLEGLEPTWVEVGSRRNAYYAGLPPGRYTFHVAARSSDGAWTREGIEFSYVIAPFFYQSRIFQAACAALILAAGWLFYRRRVNALKENERELRVRVDEAVGRIKTLSGLLPICASCKKVRDDTGYWNQIEVYVRDHSQAEFSHGICPECLATRYPEYTQDEKPAELEN